MAGKLRVLVAEDEYLVLMSLRSSLQKLGHEVVAEALDGLKAVELAVKKKPDLILMDINMPLLDGIEAITKINQKIVVPSIIVTGYSNYDLVKKATEAGVFGYLVKPIDIKELKPAIEVAIARFKEFQKLNTDLNDTKKSLEARKYIERAKGILMDNFNLKEAEAMKKLQKMSRDNNKKLINIAKEIINAFKVLND